MHNVHIHMYVHMCVFVCVHVHVHMYVYVRIFASTAMIFNSSSLAHVQLILYLLRIKLFSSTLLFGQVFFWTHSVHVHVCKKFEFQLVHCRSSNAIK